MSDTTRVLVVDDSPSMRAMLTMLLAQDPQIEVVGAAPEPHAAREMIKALNPDVITLDIEMPGMNGLSFLEKVMRLRPMPVVMCSTLTARGADATIEALRLGAVDCIGKPSGNALEMADHGALLRKMVKAAARSTVRRSPPPSAPVASLTSSATGALRDVVIAIGASTGGVEALFAVISALPVDCPPILVVQHMPAAFTHSFAARMDRDSRVRVVEAQHGMPVERGTVYIAPGGDRHMEWASGAGGVGGRIRLVASEAVSGHRPSVDMLFQSMTRLGSRGIGVIMTGMGRDGAIGLRAMRVAGAHTLGQSRETCVVYGMPRAALEGGAVEKEVSLAAMAEVILGLCRI